MKTLKVGIASLEQMKARSLAIASGKKKRIPGEPKVWFPSTETMAKVLSEKNRSLLALIVESHPDSIQTLATKSGRHKSNLSRTLKTMEKFGLVKVREGTSGRKKLTVPFQKIAVEIDLTPNRR
jgi:predicted transcriptional regulator